MTVGVVDGKVALVTGGTRGIGRGVAEALIAEGAMVVVTGRSEEKGGQAIAEMDAGERAHYIRGDMGLQRDCESAVGGTVERYGSIDILVSNAGAPRCAT
jgi:3-hydroxybutyrate dehydrogenase/3-oxoacyl-[acyl-carrier protein] reductase